MQKAQFEVGDAVAAVAIPNGFPKPRPRINGLYVTDVRLIPGTFRPDGSADLAPYYRVTARDNGLGIVEGAEFHFEHAR